MGNVTTLTSKNQLTIPSDIARSLHLAPKDRMLIEQQDGWIKATPLRARSFINLFGAVKSAEKSAKNPAYKKLRKEFERHVAKKKS